MFYKKIVLWYVIGFSLFIFGFLAVSIIVDPLDMWNIVSIRGFNHYKIKQASYLDVFKPYQYMMKKPDVVYIGSSRVYVGIPPTHPEVEDEKVYNMGCSSLSLPDMRRYLQFMYKVHKPKKVYVGLDFFQFGRENYYGHRDGFDERRLDILTANPIEKFLFKIQETVSLRELIKPTIKASKENYDKDELFLRGWDVKRGGASGPNKDEYYYTINSLLKYYREWEYEPKSLDELRSILIDGNNAGVEIKILFNPDSVDLFAILDSTEKLDEYFKVKKEVSDIYEVYDFSLYNSITQKRYLFYDALHYRGLLGKDILLSMVKSTNSGIGVILDQSNFEENIQMQRNLYLQWKSGGLNFQYVDLLKSHKDYGSVSDQEINKYINLEMGK